MKISQLSETKGHVPAQGDGQAQLQVQPAPQAFLDLLRSSKRILLSGHEHPDGDCVGSQVAMYHLCREMGAEVTILNPDPLQRNLEWLQRRTPFADYKSQRSLPAADLLVLLDCAELGRLGDL